MVERVKKIVEACLQEKSRDPVEIFCRIARSDFVRIHGPEHHVLDGAALLTAYHNAGGKIDLPAALEEMGERGQQMPGATCGLWGVCGAVSSLGAALSIIDGTGPLSTDGITRLPSAVEKFEEFNHLGYGVRFIVPELSEFSTAIGCAISALV